MTPHRLKLILLDGIFTVAKLPPYTAIPAWASSDSFLSITRSADELSIVCPKAYVPAGVLCESG